MLLRKRAWDIVREEFPKLREDDSLAEAMRKLSSCVGPDGGGGAGCLCALVYDERDMLRGALSVWDTVRFMEDSLLRSGSLRGIEEDGFDRIYRNACKVAGSTKVRDVMDRDMTQVAPDDPLLVVLESFVKKGRSYAVVTEAGKVLGVIMINDVFREISGEIISRV